jgi:PhnB protein
MSNLSKPAGYSTVSPFLMVNNAPQLIEFLQNAFGATELSRYPNPDKSILHAEVRIGDTVIMMAEADENFPAFPSWLHVYVEDVDETYQKALQLGGLSVQEPVLQEGDHDRRGGVKDHSGNTWWIATLVRTSEFT